MSFCGAIPILVSKKKSDVDISADILCLYYSSVPVKTGTVY